MNTLEKDDWCWWVVHTAWTLCTTTWHMSKVGKSELAQDFISFTAVVWGANYKSREN